MVKLVLNKPFNLELQYKINDKVSIIDIIQLQTTIHNPIINFIQNWEQWDYEQRKEGVNMAVS